MSSKKIKITSGSGETVLLSLKKDNLFLELVKKADIILGVKNSYHSGGGTVENISGGVVGYTSEEFGHVNGVPLFVHQNKSYLVISSMKQAHYDAVNEQASVAMHELGHDLGLEHSDSPHSIMQQAAPTYLYSIPEVDAKHLQQLYKGIS